MSADQPRDDLSRAVVQLLRAAGLDPADSDLARTPQRVAELWSREFLGGYALDPKEILAEPVVGEADPDVVVLTGLAFHSMCPHHLLPYQGRAHIAYVSDGRLLGFGHVARLLACFTQRLTLQERATHQVAAALMDHLPARGAACVMEATQMCLAIPHDRNQGSRVITCAFLGSLRDRADIRARLLAG